MAPAASNDNAGAAPARAGQRQEPPHTEPSYLATPASNVFHSSLPTNHQTAPTHQQHSHTLNLPRASFVEPPMAPLQRPPGAWQQGPPPIPTPPTPVTPASVLITDSNGPHFLLERWHALEAPQAQFINPTRHPLAFNGGQPFSAPAGHYVGHPPNLYVPFSALTTPSPGPTFYGSPRDMARSMMAPELLAPVMVTSGLMSPPVMTPGASYTTSHLNIPVGQTHQDQAFVQISPCDAHSPSTHAAQVQSVLAQSFRMPNPSTPYNDRGPISKRRRMRLVDPAVQQSPIIVQRSPPRPLLPNDFYPQRIVEEFSQYRWSVMVYRITENCNHATAWSWIKHTFEPLSRKGLYETQRHTTIGFIPKGTPGTFICMHNACDPFGIPISQDNTTTIGFFIDSPFAHSEINWTTYAPSLKSKMEQYWQEGVIAVAYGWPHEGTKATELRFRKGFWKAANRFHFDTLLNRGTPQHQDPVTALTEEQKTEIGAIMEHDVDEGLDDDAVFFDGAFSDAEDDKEVTEDAWNQYVATSQSEFPQPESLSMVYERFDYDEWSRLRRSYQTRARYE